MGILILGALVAIAAGMGIGTFAAHKLGIHEAIGQVAGVALVGLAAFVWMKVDDRKRAQATPPPATAITASATGESPSGGGHLTAPQPGSSLVASSGGQATGGQAVGGQAVGGQAAGEASAFAYATTSSDGLTHDALTHDALADEALVVDGSTASPEDTTGDASFNDEGVGPLEAAGDASAPSESANVHQAPRALGLVSAFES